MSKKNKEILDFIVSYIKENGYPPVVREIGDGVNLKSTSAVHSYLMQMNKEGSIETNGKPRAIKVIGYEFRKIGQEEQVAKKVARFNQGATGTWGICPSCGTNDIEKPEAYCHKCGQKLEWSD